jgi:hypothetical protein
MAEMGRIARVARSLRRLSRTQKRIVTALSVGGVVALLASWASGSGDFLPSLLLELGAGLLLFAGLYILEVVVLGERVAAVERRTDELSNAVDEVREDVQETRASLDRVGEETRNLVRTRQERDHVAIGEVRANVTAEAVGDLLRRARSLKAISDCGLRVKIADSWERLSFNADPPDGPVTVVLEKYDGELLERLIWQPDVSAAEFMAEVVEALIRHNRYPGASFDGAGIIYDLLNAVEVAMACRWGTAGPIGGLDPVIEVPNAQWALTDAGLECIQELYPITANRLGETDWKEHVGEKTWVDQRAFRSTFDLMSALVKSDMNRYYHWVNPI